MYIVLLRTIGGHALMPSTSYNSYLTIGSPILRGINSFRYVIDTHFHAPQTVRYYYAYQIHTARISRWLFTARFSDIYMFLSGMWLCVWYMWVTHFTYRCSAISRYDLIYQLILNHVVTVKCVVVGTVGGLGSVGGSSKNNKMLLKIILLTSMLL